MSFIKKLFGGKGKATENKPNDNFAEGDLFYTFFDNQYHVYKLLKIDHEFGIFHVTLYKAIDTLPKADETHALEVFVSHAPINQNGFPDAVFLTKSKIEFKDLAGYHEYLKHTDFGQYLIEMNQRPEDVLAKADQLYKAAIDLTNERKYEQAIENYTEAIVICPFFFEAIDNMAFCKMDMGQWSEAILDFKHSLLVNPESTLAEFSIGECYLNLKDYTMAKEQFEKALVIDPEHQPSIDFLEKTVKLMKS